MSIKSQLAVASVFWCFANSPALCAELTKLEKGAVLEALRARATDPDSVQVKWLPIMKYGDGDFLTYCGLVNDKNVYGGYAGFRPFAIIISGAKGSMVPEGKPLAAGWGRGSAAMNQSMVEDYCQHQGGYRMDQIEP